VTLSITKHNYLIRKVEDIAPTIKNAFKVANAGRKGPVLIDIPKDIFTTEMNFDILNYEPYKNKSENILNYNNTKKIEEVADMIKNSSKPVIYAGGGVKSSNAYKLFTKFATKIDTPILDTRK